MVETNYRIYAYTDSNLQIALLGLFTEILYRYNRKSSFDINHNIVIRFPNLCVGVISRDSCRQAFRGGITANQIIRFLNMHVLVNSSVTAAIPPTITDQIRLWEQERDRFTFTEGVLYNQFLSQTDYETVRNYADELGCVVWNSDPKRTLVVTKDGHDDVKRYWRQQSRR